MGKKLMRSSVGFLLRVALLAACGDDADEAITGGEALGGGGTADCMPYDEAVLAAQEVAFDGTLTAGSADGTDEEGVAREDADGRRAAALVGDHVNHVLRRVTRRL